MRKLLNIASLIVLMLGIILFAMGVYEIWQARPSAQKCSTGIYTINNYVKSGKVLQPYTC